MPVSLPLVSPAVEFLDAHKHLSALLVTSSVNVSRQNAHLVLEINRHGDVVSEREPDKKELFLLLKFDGQKCLFNTKAEWLPVLSDSVKEISQRIPETPATKAYLKFLEKRVYGSATPWTSKKHANKKHKIAVSCATWATPDLHDKMYEYDLIEYDNNSGKDGDLDRFGNYAGDGTLRCNVSGILNIASCNPTGNRSIWRYGKHSFGMLRVGVGTAEKTQSVLNYLWSTLDSKGHPLHRRYVQEEPQGESGNIITYVVGDDQYLAKNLNDAMDRDFSEDLTPDEKAAQLQSAAKARTDAVYLKPSRRDAKIHVIYVVRKQDRIGIKSRFEQNTDEINRHIQKWNESCGEKPFTILGRWKWIYSAGAGQKPPSRAKITDLLSAFFGDNIAAKNTAVGIFQDRQHQIFLALSNTESDDTRIGFAAWSLITALLFHGDCMSDVQLTPAFRHGLAMRKLDEIQRKYHYAKHGKSIKQTIAEKRLRDVALRPNQFADVYTSPQLSDIIPWAERNAFYLTKELKNIMSQYQVPSNFTADERMAFVAGWNYVPQTPIPAEKVTNEV